MGITVKGLREFQAAMGVLETMQFMVPAMEKTLLFVQNAAANYPPKRGGTYRRTGTLGRRWTRARQRISKSGGGWVGRVGNNTKYAHWVQDRRTQARVHRGRWQTVQDIAEGNLFRQRMGEFFIDAMDDALGR